MLEARAMDSKLSALYKAGMITGGVYLGKGQEAISASMGVNAIAGVDMFAPAIRDQAARLGWGEALIEAPRAYFGSVLGPMRGRDGNVHRGYPDQGYLAMISHLGSSVAVVAGGLLAKRMNGTLKGSIGLVSYGDGTTSTGAFHEGMNIAVVEDVPLLMIVTNNLFAYSTPNERQFGHADLVKRLQGYGIEVDEVNGTDFLETVQTISRASDILRERGRGPRAVVATALRLCGHGEHDDASYIPDELRKSCYGRDCLQVGINQVIEMGWLDAAQIEAMQKEVDEQVVEAVATARREPVPDAFSQDWNATAWNPHLSQA